MTRLLAERPRNHWLDTCFPNRLYGCSDSMVNHWAAYCQLDLTGYGASSAIPISRPFVPQKKHLADVKQAATS